MTDDMTNWKEIATHLCEALPQVDGFLSQKNVPIPARPLKAFDIVRDMMLEVSDYKTFYLSEVHGRMQIIIDEWYRRRYGNAVDDDKDGVFCVDVASL